MEVLEILKTLTGTPGPSGMESDIATVIAEIWRPYVDEVSFDRLGNVVAVKHGSGEAPRPRVMFSAHMDEIALMVSDVLAHNGYGFLRVVQVGGVDLRQVMAQRVVVHGRRNLPGVIGCLPNTYLEPVKRPKVRDYDDLIVDVGLSAETTRNLVRIGDFVTFDQPVHELQGGNVATKSVDNRACVAALTVALERLQGRTHSWDVVMAATIQEETRLLGGYTTGFEQHPDVAVALDVSFATQPGLSTGTFELGSGPILDIGVNVHPGVLTGLRKSAEALEMKVGTLPHTRASGTEAAAIQTRRAGIPMGLISIPIRYMHTMVETVSLKDIKRAGRLVSEFAVQLDDQFLSGLTKELLREAAS